MAGNASTVSAKSAPKLLSGGNPQIPKGYGDALVHRRHAGLEERRRAQARRHHPSGRPGERKAVKWNSPFLRRRRLGPGLVLHCFTKYVKATFFRRRSLRPVPPRRVRHPEVRCLDIYEDRLDEAQFADWVKQASELLGERM